MIVLRVKALQTIAVLCLIGAFIMVILYCVNSSHNQSGLLRHRNFKPSAKFLKALNVRKKNHEKRSKFLKHIKAAMNKKKRKKKRIRNETKGREANMVRRKAKVQLNHHDLKLQTELIKAFALKDNDARHPFANMHKFNYTLSPSRCHKKPVFLLTIVHSKPHDFRQRLTFRKTFGQIQSSWKKRIVYVFSMGLVSDPKLQQLIQKEAATFNDIIQGGFDDLEENLALKHIMGLHWKNKYCRHAKFILKIDDDVFIHPFGIIKNILGKSKRKHFMSCREGSGKAVIEKMKNRKLRATYPVDFVPSFCNGYAIVMSSDVASGILAASEKIRYVPLEDLFITGVLRLVSGIGLSSTEVIHGNCHPRLFTGKEIVKITALHLAGKCKNKMSKLWKRYHKVFKGQRKLKV